MAKKKASPSQTNEIYGFAWLGIALYAIGSIIFTAYDIRLAAIKEYGPVIHEFDPYFNFRATEVSRWLSLLFGKLIMSFVLK